jgi:hypothetical protein
MAQNARKISFHFDTDTDPTYSAPNHTGTPERNLILAMLERAILDSVGNDAKEAEDAEEWLFNLDDNEEFSFNWVCEQLELDPKQISKTVSQMPKRGARKVAPWYFARPELVAAN